MEEYNEKYLKAMSEKYPTRLSAKIRLTELNARLNMPKGTEHFMSDLHGEAEAFLHIRRNASGVIKNKIRLLFSDTLSLEEMSELATLIYYPEEKLKEVVDTKGADRLELTIYRMIDVLRKVGEKYSINTFYDRIVGNACGFEHQIMQIVWRDSQDGDHFKNEITKGVITASLTRDFICALSSAIRALVIDRLHVIGDVFDRGARPDVILDELMNERVDVEWGNHDVLWMGAAAGSEACIAAVMNTSLTYGNLDVLEFGYGISLRPLAVFADEIYGKSDCECFSPRIDAARSIDKGLIAKMNKAIAVIRFKAEGEVILRNPHFMMEDRLFLETIDKKRGTVKISGKEYPMKDVHLPTVNKDTPYVLTDGERAVIDYYKAAFTESKKLREHVKFLYRVGSIYRIYNGNLLFHGCVPLTDEGGLMKLPAAGERGGRALMDYCDKMARDGFFAEVGSEKRRLGEDFLWFLGSGKNSPLLGREKMATFERFLLSDEKIKEEPKNAYYKLAWQRRDVAEKILAEFGLRGDGAHIINGHIPQIRGENPIKAGGRLIVIDGGFCSAYHKATGCAGYTLIYNAEGMRLSAHEPFCGKENAVKNNGDILSETEIFETREQRIRIRETDLGEEIREEMCDLMTLLEAYKNGTIPEKQ